ncbi:MAG: murein biosynthesis integral membrane protein MurJ [Phycisphaerae bacterium]
MTQQTRLFGSARLISLCTVASRITGLARDILLNRAYGQGWVQDAFNYGFLIPNLFRRLFGEGALSAVFVPVFTDVLDQKGRVAAWVLLGRVTGLLALALVALTLLVEVGVLAAASFSTGGRELHIGLTAVMAPFMIGVCLLALFSSILNCLNHFTVPALLPIVLNVMIVLGVVLVGPMVGTMLNNHALDHQIYGVAACVLVASVLQLVIILPVLRRHGVRFRWSLNTADPDLRRILRTFIPVLIGQGVLLFNVFFDAQICTTLTRPPGAPATGSFLGMEFVYPLAQGALSAVNNAQRLYQFPLGVLAIALATAALPMFSLHASRGEMTGLRSSVAQSLRLAIYEGLPAGLMMLVLAAPIISLLFEHGRFGPEQTERAARILRWYGVGMAAFCAQHILLRAFYSLKDTLTPMWISCGLVALNWIMNLTLVWHLREAAFAISTSTTSILHVTLSVWFLRKRMGGRIGARQIATSIGRTIIGGALALATAYLLLEWTQGWFTGGPQEVFARVACVFVPLLGATGIYLASTRWMGMEEVGWLLGHRRASPSAR